MNRDLRPSRAPRSLGDSMSTGCGRVGGAAVVQRNPMRNGLEGERLEARGLGVGEL